MSGSVFRSPVVVDASAGNAVAKVTVGAQPIRAERITAEHVQDPDVLAAQLTRIVKAQADSTNEARGDALRGPTVYKGLTVYTAGTKLIIKHNLGRRAFWWIVGWYGNVAASGHSLASDEQDASGVLTDANTLALRSYVAGIVDVAVA